MSCKVTSFNCFKCFNQQYIPQVLGTGDLMVRLGVEAKKFKTY